MERIVDDRGLQTRTTDELTAAVQKELDSGWLLHGGQEALPEGAWPRPCMRPGPGAADGGSRDTARAHVIAHGRNLTDRQR
jgi:hypothetical protein